MCLGFWKSTYIFYLHQCCGFHLNACLLKHAQLDLQLIGVCAIIKCLHFRDCIMYFFRCFHLLCSMCAEGSMNPPHCMAGFPVAVTQGNLIHMCEWAFKEQLSTHKGAAWHKHSQQTQGLPLAQTALYSWGVKFGASNLPCYFYDAIIKRVSLRFQ